MGCNGAPCAVANGSDDGESEPAPIEPLEGLEDAVDFRWRYKWSGVGHWQDSPAALAPVVTSTRPSVTAWQTALVRSMDRRLDTTRPALARARPASSLESTLASGNDSAKARACAISAITLCCISYTFARLGLAIAGHAGHHYGWQSWGVFA